MIMVGDFLFSRCPLKMRFMAPVELDLKNLIKNIGEV